MQITGGWVYDPEEGFAERTVCTDGEKIARSSGDAQNLDASGCYVLPLLIDLHIHGYAGADVGSAEPAELERMARALLMQGVGAFCPTTMTLPEARLAAVCRCTAAYCKEQHPGAQAAGVHLEGPFLARERRGSHDEALLQNPDPELLRRLQKAGEGVVRLMTLAPELPGALPLIQMAVKQGVRVSLGHTQADYDTAQAALRAGAAQCTHLLNAMTPFGHRAPGVMGAAFDVPDTMVELICDGIHVHPAMVRAILPAFWTGTVLLVSDALPGGGNAGGNLLPGQSGNHGAPWPGGAVRQAGNSGGVCVRFDGMPAPGGFLWDSPGRCGAGRQLESRLCSGDGDPGWAACGRTGSRCGFAGAGDTGDPGRGSPWLYGGAIKNQRPAVCRPLGKFRILLSDCRVRQTLPE